MKYEKKVFVGNGAFVSNVLRMFTSRGWKIAGPDEADFLCLTGGGDLNPAMYNEKPLRTTYFSESQDKYDLDLIEKFKDKPKLGICRGGQILNVFSGGSMFQDVNNHERQHAAVDKRTNELFAVSSLHHQMMIPSKNAEILAVAFVSTERFRFEASYIVKDKEKTFKDDIEACYYPDTKSLCFQPHPEIGPKPCTDYFFDLIDEKFFNNIGA